MTIQKRTREKIKEREFIWYKKTYSDGEIKNKSLIKFLKPKIARGIGFLTWNYEDGHHDQWLFMPKLKMVKKIKSKDRSKKFLGTEFTYEDLQSQAHPEYKYMQVEADTIYNKQCYAVMIKLDNDSEYTQKRIWVDTQNWLIQKIEYYGDQNQLIKELTIPEYSQFGIYWTAARMTMKNLVNGNVTEMELTDFQYDTDLPNDYFSEEFLKMGE